MNVVKQPRSIQHPPPTLYKYCPPERIDILENLAIRFSRPSEFNDHFDSHYLVPRDQGAKAKASRLRFKSHLGVFCLTERPDDHLMWVNYARNHTGFVIGFDARSPFFSEDYRLLKKVEYRDHLPFQQEAGVVACFIKSAVWKDEVEWRCVRTFDQTDSRIVDIDASIITEVIFGSRMEDWRIARISLFVPIFERAMFFLSSPSSSGFAFENNPKKLAVCEHCSGAGYQMTDLD